MFIAGFIYPEIFRTWVPWIGFLHFYVDASRVSRNMQLTLLTTLQNKFSDDSPEAPRIPNCTHHSQRQLVSAETHRFLWQKRSPGEPFTRITLRWFTMPVNNATHWWNHFGRALVHTMRRLLRKTLTTAAVHRYLEVQNAAKNSDNNMLLPFALDIIYKISSAKESCHSDILNFHFSCPRMEKSVATLVHK